MKISQKQKKALIRELDTFSSPRRIPAKPAKKAKQRSRQPFGKGSVMNGPRNVVGPSQRGISNVLGQRTDIPLTQTFAGSESLGRFNGSITFTELQFPLNPGQAGTFPWLSQEAKLWEKYEFDKLDIEFRTTINEFSANAFGRVILGVDFDASDPAPSTRSQAEISRPVTAQAPYFNQLLKLRKQDMHDSVRKHYVRPGNLPGGADIKMYDVGNLNFGTDGNIGTNEVGELWVHYSGTFTNQVLESISTAPINNQVAVFTDLGAQILATGVAKTHALVTAVTNGLLAVNTAGSILLPAGNYLVYGSTTDVFGTSGTVMSSAIEQGGAVIPGMGQQNGAFGAAAVCTGWGGNPMAYVVSTGLAASAISLVTTDTFTGASTSTGNLIIVAV
jgi:hypothetical protein